MCQILGCSGAAQNNHHVIPQSCGGKQGPTVDLCASHHDEVHLQVNANMVKYRKGEVVECRVRDLRQVFGPTGQTTVCILVDVATQSFIHKSLSAPTAPTKLTLELDPATHNALKLLKLRKGGKGNLPQLVLAYVQQALRGEGLLP